MKVTMIPIVVGALATVTKGLVSVTGGFGNERTSGDRPNIALLRSVRILGRVLET